MQKLACSVLMTRPVSHPPCRFPMQCPPHPNVARQTGPDISGSPQFSDSPSGRWSSQKAFSHISHRNSRPPAAAVLRPQVEHVWCGQPLQKDEGVR